MDEEYGYAPGPLLNHPSSGFRQSNCQACINEKNGVKTRQMVLHTCGKYDRPKTPSRDYDYRWEADQQTEHNE